MAEAVVGLGGNLGDRPGNLNKAVESLGRLSGTRVLAVSPFYETAPFGVPDEQPDYLNCCVRLETGLSPHALLGACLGIEAALGRTRPGEKSARCIDIDLLLYEGQALCTAELTLPHPRMLERGFVLVPLSDLFAGQNALGLDFSQEFKSVEKSGVKPYPGKSI